MFTVGRFIGPLQKKLWHIKTTPLSVYLFILESLHQFNPSISTPLYSQSQPSLKSEFNMPDPNKIRACKRLVEEAIPQEFPGSDSSAIVKRHLEPIVALGLVQLWAQHLGDGTSKTIQPNMPEIKRFLMTLAESGTTGRGEEYDDVKFVFIAGMLPGSVRTMGI